jgi:hypothetical protein
MGFVNLRGDMGVPRTELEEQMDKLPNNCCHKDNVGAIL